MWMLVFWFVTPCGLAGSTGVSHGAITQKTDTDKLIVVRICTQVISYPPPPQKKIVITFCANVLRISS
jgi:hypothetical protein